MLLAAFLVGSAHAQQAWPPDAVIEEAAELQITDEGLDAIVDVIPSLIPGNLPLDTLAGEDGWWCANYAYELSNIWVGIEVTGADLSPGNGVLDVEADLQIRVNDSSDKFNIWYEIACIDTSCPGYVDPFDVHLTTTVAMEVVPADNGTQALDATIGDINADIDYDTLAENIQLDCWIGDVEEVLNWFGLSLYDLLFSLVGGALDSAIAGFGPDLEQTIEEAFSAANIEEQIDVNGAVVDLKLYPDEIEITPDGITVVMGGSMSSSEPALCIADSDPGGSLRTDSPLPGIAGLPSGTHVGILLSDDFTNEAMYALYRGGVLCYELSGNDPLPINSSLLQLIAGDVFDELFPETQPMIIATQPRSPPEAYFDGPHSLDLAVNDLDLHFYAEVDGRMARVVTLALDIDAGADLVFDPQTGDLEILLDISSENVTADVVHNELVVGSDETIEANFGGAFDTILDTVVGGLLADLAFGMPSFEGIGITTLDVQPVGPQQDWLGIMAGIGQTPYVGGDCSDCSGGGSGCSGGCAVGGPILNFWMALALSVVAVRRRS